MARKITFEFTGGLRLLREVAWLLSQKRVRYGVTIEKTNGKALHREVHFPTSVRVRAFRAPNSGPTELKEI
jgi:hypothetical protein